MSNKNSVNIKSSPKINYKRLYHLFLFLKKASFFRLEVWIWCYNKLYISRVIFVLKMYAYQIKYHTLYIQIDNLIWIIEGRKL